MSNVRFFQRYLELVARRGSGAYAKAVVESLRSHGLTPELYTQKPDPVTYIDPDDFFEDYQIFELIRKAPIDFGGIDREAAATESFFVSERRCYITNQFFDRYLTAPTLESAAQVRFWEILLEVKKDIRIMLGKVPDHLEPTFTSGATLSDKHEKTTILDKLSSLPTAYPACTDITAHLIRRTLWADAVEENSSADYPVVAAANHFFCVPKDWSTDRGCAKEASAALVFQRAVAKHLRKRMRRWGLDLEHGAQRHQKLAQLGSLTGQYATIDLKQASDTIARKMLKAVIVEDWYDLLDALRAPKTKVGDKVYLLEKFSSMGNGFTFELETLVFAAICRYVCRESGVAQSDVTVYGDDVIVPVAVVDRVLELFELFGFECNRRKTHVRGPFRESCGGEYFQGVPVKPARLKKEPVHPADWISVHNMCEAASTNNRRRHLLSGLKAYALGQLPTSVRKCVGPVHLGDIVLHQDYEPVLRLPHKGGPLAPVYEPIRHVKAYVPQPVRKALFTRGHRRWGENTTLAAILLGADSSGVTPRQEIDDYRFVWVPIDGRSNEREAR